PRNFAPFRRPAHLSRGVSLSPSLQARRPRLDQRAVGREARTAPAPMLSAHGGRSPCPGSAAWTVVLLRDGPYQGRGVAPCVIGGTRVARGSRTRETRC